MHQTYYLRRTSRGATWSVLRRLLGWVIWHWLGVAWSLHFEISKPLTSDHQQLMVAGDRSGALHVVQKVPFILQPALPSSCMLPLLSCSFSSLCFIASILDCELRKAPVFSMRLLRWPEQVASGFVAVVIFHVLKLKLASNWALCLSWSCLLWW